MASQTTITVTPSAYTALGTGPLLVAALNAPVLISVSDAQPSAGSAGFVLLPGEPKEIKASANVWASSVAGPASLTYGPLSGPSMSNISGLAAVLANGGWQILGDKPSCQDHASPITLSSFKPGAPPYTVRWRIRAMFASHHIVLVFGNWGDPASGILGAAGRNRVRIYAAIQKMGASGYTDASGDQVPVTFGGSRFGEIPHNGPLYSDPIPFEVAQNEVFFVNHARFTPGPNCPVNVHTGVAGGTGAGGLNNGEGWVAGNLVDSPASITQTADQWNFSGGPVAVLGFSASPQKTVALIGDSICVGLNDGGIEAYRGGYLYRLMRNYTVQTLNSAIEQNTIANFPFVQCAQGGILASQFATRLNSWKSMRIAEMASTIIFEFGTNDVYSGTSLAAMQANLLKIANWFIARGKKFIACTLLPRTNTSDGWQTISGQSFQNSGYETVRQNYNAWLRDGSASGFIAQAGGSSAADIFDAAAAVEVNSSGVLTLNGGYWPAALPGPNFTGAITSAPSVGGFTDTSITGTDTYRGHTVRFTSGAQNNAVANINYHTSGGAVTFVDALAGAPAVGDTYVILDAYTGRDGTHPSALGHMTIANYLNTPANLAKIV